ncbi:hypothetical protein [Bradyrhizobium sp. RDM4]|uniref:hypothetical protein n=1 Tax=Bradyrhizobium sp. RDM4 TaxID=3378765 RepID=UPI0038FD16D1
MAKKTKASEAPHLRIRLDTSLLERLEKSRAKAGRTLTGEITDRLEASFKREDMQAYIDATAQAISERLIAATAEREKIIEEELVKMDIELLPQILPNVPKETIETYVRESMDRRRARRKAK